MLNNISGRIILSTVKERKGERFIFFLFSPFGYVTVELTTADEIKIHLIDMNDEEDEYTRQDDENNHIKDKYV